MQLECRTSSTTVAPTHLRHHSNPVCIAMSKNLGYLLGVLWFQGQSAAAFVLSDPVPEYKYMCVQEDKHFVWHRCAILHAFRPQPVEGLQSVGLSDNASVSKHVSEESNVTIRDCSVLISSGCSCSSLSTPCELTQSM